MIEVFVNVISPVSKLISGVLDVKDAVGPGTTQTTLLMVVSAVHPLTSVMVIVALIHPSVFNATLNWLELLLTPVDKFHKTLVKVPILALVKVTLAGKQTTLSLTVNEAINAGGLLRVALALDTQPLASDTCTVYVPGPSKLLILPTAAPGCQT